MDFWPNHPSTALRLRWRGGVVHLLQWNSPFLTPRARKKVEKHFSVWFLILVPIFGLWVQKTINSWTSYGSLLRNLLITSQRWHVPKEMKTRKINKGSCLIMVNHGKTLKANPMHKSCRSSMWSTSFEEKCRCDFPTKSLQDSGRHPKADAKTGSGARGLSFHLVGKCWLV